jgi:hypothetical protein
MRAEDSPFPLGWWGTDMADVGLEEERPLLSTYRRYDFTRLPPLPYPMTGDLDWLARARPHPDKEHIGAA